MILLRRQGGAKWQWAQHSLAANCSATIGEACWTSYPVRRYCADWDPYWVRVEPAVFHASSALGSLVPVLQSWISCYYWRPQRHRPWKDSAAAACCCRSLWSDWRTPLSAAISTSRGFDRRRWQWRPWQKRTKRQPAPNCRSSDSWPARPTTAENVTVAVAAPSRPSSCRHRGRMAGRSEPQSTRCWWPCWSKDHWRRCLYASPPCHHPHPPHVSISNENTNGWE